MVSAFEYCVGYVWVAQVENLAKQPFNFADCFTVANVIDIF